jgi:hypothetical protein
VTRETKETETSITELEEAYRKFLRLYERFAADRLTISKQGEALDKIIEELKAESSLATEFKIQVREGILESVEKLVKEVDTQIKESIQKSITEELNKSLKDFKYAINNGTEILEDYVKDRKVRNIWVYCGVIFCGFILFFTATTALKVRKYLPGTYLSSHQLSIYENGLMFDKIWNRVSKKERDRLTRIWLGTIPAEENSYEWIKDKNPKMNDEEIQKKFKELNNLDNINTK